MASKKIYIFIDGKRVTTCEGRTVLEAAKENSLYIPSLCHHSDLKIKANCRVCCVKVEGSESLLPACSTKVYEGMKVITNSAQVRQARKTNLELVFAQHNEECQDCVWNKGCDLLKLAKENQIKIRRFEDRKKNYPVWQFGDFIHFDSSKCIDCGNCVEVCRNQGVGFLEIKKSGNFHQIVPSKKESSDCVYCGQCLMHCPAGAFEAETEFEKIQDPFKQKDKKIVFQFAPAIRSSLEEEFKISKKSNLTGKVIAAARKLGAHKVFDTSVGADFTTVTEAAEVVERIKKNENLPIMTSCCPSWVKYVELHYPEFIKNLSTARSPHVILGALIKTYWAKKEGLNPKNILVVSVMPCVAKKYEITKSGLKIKGIRPVDFVLTTREFARLIQDRGIDFTRLKPGKPDLVFGEPSGAGVIYGASGGVMESAFRTAYEKLTGLKLKNIDFKEIRGPEQVKEAEVSLNGIKRKIAVINGLGNAKNFLENLKTNKESGYTCVEVMACFGGCIGGGGQPLPADKQIRQKRAEILYLIDRNKKIRKAHENPAVKEIFASFLTKNQSLARKILHTKHRRKFRGYVKKYGKNKNLKF